MSQKKIGAVKSEVEILQDSQPLFLLRKAAIVYSIVSRCFHFLFPFRKCFLGSAHPVRAIMLSTKPLENKEAGLELLDQNSSPA